MDSRHDFTLEKVFWGYFGALDQKANSALKVLRVPQVVGSWNKPPNGGQKKPTPNNNKADFGKRFRRD